MALIKKSGGALFIAIIVSMIASASTWAQDAKANVDVAYKKANPKRIEGYIVLLRLRYDLYGKWKDTGKWPDDDKAANEALSGHAAYWAEQLKKGKVLMTGGMKGDYWDNVAVIVLESGSEEEAKQLAANDPAVKAYVFQAQVRGFDIHGLTNKYTSKAQ